jgi:hypothetical protein
MEKLSGSLAEAVGGRWSHREKSFIVSPSQKELFLKLVEMAQALTVLAEKSSSGTRKG